MVRIGILGAGNIARRFAVSLAGVEGAELVAASCRTARKAEEFLASVPCAEDAKAHGGHDQILANDEVDAIYLALPHAYHYQWAIAAIEAGKDVLCEKPAFLTAGEATEVAHVARSQGRLFMEAMKPRFQPLHTQVIQAVEQIGGVERVEATLCNDMLAMVEGTGSYHMTPGPGAGVLLDCGTYCASWIAEFAAGNPKVVSVTGAKKDGIDTYANAELVFQNCTAQLECAFDRAKPRTATIIGARGAIVVDELHRPTHATVTLANGNVYELDAPYEGDDFTGEVSHFVGLVASGATESSAMTCEDTIRCARILDVVRDNM